MRDEAVSEVIGFILMFALSSVILLISVHSFTAAKNDSAAVLAAAEMKSIATRVSSRLVEAGLVSQDFPEAKFNVTLEMPRQVAGYEYKVEIYSKAVNVTGLSGVPAPTSSTTFRLDAYATGNACFAIRGSAVSSYGMMAVSYQKDSLPKPAGCSASTWQAIELKGVN